MTNEQRFIVSCGSVGEAYVQQKLSGRRYTERKLAWANSWQERVESGKSVATKFEEKSRRVRKANRNVISLRCF
jgi:hypothetical protein